MSRITPRGFESYQRCWLFPSVNCFDRDVSKRPKFTNAAALVMYTHHNCRREASRIYISSCSAASAWGLWLWSQGCLSLAYRFHYRQACACDVTAGAAARGGAFPRARRVLLSSCMRARDRVMPTRCGLVTDCCPYVQLFNFTAMDLLWTAVHPWGSRVRLCVWLITSTSSVTTAVGRWCVISGVTPRRVVCYYFHHIGCRRSVNLASTAVDHSASCVVATGVLPVMIGHLAMSAAALALVAMVCLCHNRRGNVWFVHLTQRLPSCVDYFSEGSFLLTAVSVFPGSALCYHSRGMMACQNYPRCIVCCRRLVRRC